MDDMTIVYAIQDLRKRIKNLATSTVEGPQGPQGLQGEQGPPGKDGKPGKDGPSGPPGKQGLNGKDGKDGVNGEQGVSIVDVEIDIDGHLVVTLSDGQTIDAGSVEPLSSEGNTIYNISQVSGGGGGLDSNLDISNKGFTARFTAAEPLITGVVTALNSSSKMTKTGALNENTTRPLLGLNISGLSTDDSGLFLLKGFYPLEGFTPGAVLYLSETSGELTEFPPDTDGAFVRVVGYCTTADEIFFDPDKTWIRVNDAV